MSLSQEPILSQKLPFSPAQEAPIKILMIEDNVEHVQLIKKMLASQDDVIFNLEHADRFNLGLKYLHDHPTDVVLLDLSLPDAKGFEMFERLRAEVPEVPIIVFTSTDNEQLAVYTVRQGAQDYLVKGKVDRALLVRSIRHAMERQRLLLDIIEHKKDKVQIKAELKEKDVLLKEIHHRVKNNLQIISSLLRLQTSSLQDQRDLEVFKDCQGKIRSMALIHEILYQSENLARINFLDYIRKLTAGLFHSYGIKSDAISLEIRAENILLSVDVAIPCGLIVNELVSNAIKHAFPQKNKGKIWINFIANQDKQTVTMTVGDNGIGFPNGTNIRNTKSLGMRLVSTLTDQVGGEIEVQSQEGKGTEIKVTFTSSEDGATRGNARGSLNPSALSSAKASKESLRSLGKEGESRQS